MFKNGGFYVNYFISGFRHQYRGLMRVSSLLTHRFNLTLFTIVFWRVQLDIVHDGPDLFRPLYGEARDKRIVARCQHTAIISNY